MEQKRGPKINNCDSIGWRLVASPEGRAHCCVLTAAGSTFEPWTCIPLLEFNFSAIAGRPDYRHSRTVATTSFRFPAGLLLGASILVGFDVNYNFEDSCLCSYLESRARLSLFMRPAELDGSGDGRHSLVGNIEMEAVKLQVHHLLVVFRPNRRTDSGVSARRAG